MQQNWCDYLKRYFFPCSPISWGAYGGIQPTTLGLCSMIVGPCHVRASPEITLDKKSEKKLKRSLKSLCYVANLK